jgi:FMN-dependent NADH-azoreductase
MNILHIDASILGAQSITRDLSAAIAAAVPHTRRRGLPRCGAAGNPPPYRCHCRRIPPSGVSTFDAATLQEHQLSELLLQEFMASDAIVVGTPMYNFSVPTQLKAWLDRLAQAGRSFESTTLSLVPLVWRWQARDCRLGPWWLLCRRPAGTHGLPGAICAFFGFLGIDDVQFVRAEGASKTAEIRQAGIAKAKSAIGSL